MDVKSAGGSPAHTRPGCRCVAGQAARHHHCQCHRRPWPIRCGNFGRVCRCAETPRDCVPIFRADASAASRASSRCTGAVQRGPGGRAHRAEYHARCAWLCGAPRHVHREWRGSAACKCAGARWQHCGSALASDSSQAWPARPFVVWHVRLLHSRGRRPWRAAADVGPPANRARSAAPCSAVVCQSHLAAGLSSRG